MRSPSRRSPVDPLFVSVGEGDVLAADLREHILVEEQLVRSGSPALRTTMIATFVGLLLCSLLTSSVWAAEFEVASAAELQNALDLASGNGEDDIIRLTEGTYRGNFGITPEEAHTLAIMGTHGTAARDVVLDGNNSGPVLDLSCSTVASTVRVEGLTIQHGAESGVKLVCGDGSITAVFDRVIVQQNVNEYRGGGFRIRADENGSANVTIANAIVRDNRSPGYADGRQGRGGGIRAYSSGGNSSIDLYVVNSLIYDNMANWTGGGFDIAASEVGGYNAARAVILNSTVVGNTSNMTGATWAPGGGIRVRSYEGISTTVALDLYNTILRGNTALGSAGHDLFISGAAAGGVAVNAVHSNVHDVEADPGTYMPANVIDVDPRFVDPGLRDFRLRPGSPCADAGTDAVPEPPGLPPLDINGDPRLLGSAPDIGADEVWPQCFIPLALHRQPWVVAYHNVSRSRDTSGR